MQCNGDPRLLHHTLYMRKIVVLTLAGVLLCVFAAPSIALPRVVLQADVQPWIAASAMPAITADLHLYELPQTHRSELHFALGSAQLASVVLIC
ncbi:MAG TPA: hypothetical protein VN669_11460 [Candidatus Acidoferrales bacterium]|nr:hypothetical protein [Candidatus Acidoferrales bacterium]